MNNKIKNTVERRMLVAFTPSHGEIEYQLSLDKEADTIWVTELQIALIYEVRR